MAVRWRFLQYESTGGRKSIDDWRKDIPRGLPQADLDTFLKLLAKTAEWPGPDIASLHGKRYRGLTELRWKSGRVPYRRVLNGFGGDARIRRSDEANSVVRGEIVGTCLKFSLDNDPKNNYHEFCFFWFLCTV